MIGGHDYVDILEADRQSNDWRILERIELDYEELRIREHEYPSARVAMDELVFAYAVPRVIGTHVGDEEVSTIYMRLRRGGPWRRVAEVPGIVYTLEVEQGSRMVVGFGKSWAEYTGKLGYEWSWIFESNGTTFDKVAEIRQASGATTSHFVQLDGDHAAALVRVFDESNWLDYSYKDLVVYKRVEPGVWERVQRLTMPNAWLWGLRVIPFDLNDGLLVLRSLSWGDPNLAHMERVWVFRRGAGDSYQLEATLPLPSGPNYQHGHGQVAIVGNRFYLSGRRSNSLHDTPIWRYRRAWDGVYFWVPDWVLAPGALFIEASRDWLVGTHVDRWTSRSSFPVFQAFPAPP